MKKAPLLMGLVIAGILVSAGLCYVLSLLFYELMIATSLFSRSSHYAPFIFISLVIAPLSLLAGSFLTGFLAQPSVKKAGLSYLLLSPGLYLALGWFFYWIVLPEEISGFESLAILSSITWTAFSSLGVFLGFKFRTRKRYPPVSFDLSKDVP
ncbi:MAG: hypothetical protein WCC00_10905 [Candidatus Aminicenantales bacterium]